jgi:hypothetical protein
MSSRSRNSVFAATAVHRLDSAKLFRIALDAAPPGSTLHAVADEGVPTRAIAGVIGRHLDVPVVSVPVEQAPGHFTWLAGFFGLDAPASSALTRQVIGWQPTHAGLLDDLDEGHYFLASAARPSAQARHALGSQTLGPPDAAVAVRLRPGGVSSRGRRRCGAARATPPGRHEIPWKRMPSHERTLMLI